MSIIRSMDTDQIIEWVKATSNGDLRKVAADTGISHAALCAIKYNRTKNPTGRYCDILRKYIADLKEFGPGRQ